MARDARGDAGADRPIPAPRARSTPLLLFLLLLLAATPSRAADSEPKGGVESITGKELLAHVKALASPAMQGRSSGTYGCDAAAKYIQGQFKKSELAGGLKDGKFYQPFPITLRAGLGTQCVLMLLSARGTKTFAVEKDFVPFSFSANGAKKGKVLFAGYGITAPEFGWDDYAGVEAKGRIVLCLRHEPRAEDESSPFRGKESTEHAHFITKVLNAQRHEAAGVLIVNDPLSIPIGSDDMMPFGGPSDPRVKIPAAFVLQGVAEEVLLGCGSSLRQLQTRMDGDMKPASFEVAGKTAGLGADVQRLTAATQNVVAFLEGADPDRKGEFVIVGAHYDHIGTGLYGSRLGAQGRGKVHPGADDNASGTAAILELAQAFAERPERPKRSLLFVAFTGEERGLLGSGFYAGDPARPLDKTVAMLNLDMISRGPEQAATVEFADTWGKWKEILDGAGRELRLRLQTSPGGTGASDHAAFLQAKIPCLFFFSGIHDDYHTPGDTSEKTNPRTMEGIARLAFLAALAAADSPERPAFREPKQDERPLPYLGIVAGKEVKEVGLEVGDVQKESPAEKGGLKKGDVIAELDGRQVRSYQDLKDALAMKKAGDDVKVVAVRGGVETELTVKLGDKPRGG